MLSSLRAERAKALLRDTRRGVRTLGAIAHERGGDAPTPRRGALTHRALKSRLATQEREELFRPLGVRENLATRATERLLTRRCSSRHRFDVARHTQELALRNACTSRIGSASATA